MKEMVGPAFERNAFRWKTLKTVVLPFLRGDDLKQARDCERRARDVAAQLLNALSEWKSFAEAQSIGGYWTEFLRSNRLREPLESALGRIEWWQHTNQVGGENAKRPHPSLLRAERHDSEMRYLVYDFFHVFPYLKTDDPERAATSRDLAVVSLLAYPPDKAEIDGDTVAEVIEKRKKAVDGMIRSLEKETRKSGLKDWSWGGQARRRSARVAKR